MNGSQRCLTLIKGRHRFLFNYVEGREANVLAALVSLAGDPHSGFDWFDAAALSFQMGRHAPARPAPLVPAAMWQRS